MEWKYRVTQDISSDPMLWQFLPFGILATASCWIRLNLRISRIGISEGQQCFDDLTHTCTAIFSNGFGYFVNIDFGFEDFPELWSLTMLWWSHRHPFVHIFLVNFDSSSFFSRYLISTMRSSKILYWTNLNEFSISPAPHSWRQQKEANLGNFVQRFPSNSNPTTDFLDIFTFFQNFFRAFLSSWFVCKAQGVVKLLKFDFPHKFCRKWRACWFNFHFGRKPWIRD